MSNSIRFFLITIFSVLFFHLSAQEEEDRDYSEWLSIGVYMPIDTVYGLKRDQIKRLENKVISIISKNGIAAKISASRVKADTTGNPDFMSLMAKGVVCVPKFEIYDSRKVDAGMKKITVVDVSLTLTIQYIYEDVIFSDTTLELQGSGNSKTKAINNAIRNVKTRHNRWSKFLNETHGEIVRYYGGMCDKLMAQAKQLNKIHLTSQALAILWPIPREVDCHSQVEELTIEIYENHMHKQCKKEMLRSKALLAANRFDEGLGVLAMIDPSSDCYDSAVEMIELNEKEFDENEKANRSAQMLMKQQELEMERLKSKHISQIVGEEKSTSFYTKINQ